jgi:sterol desaturase/sphingolipid hydroxylase (fatty acid hydroxylase superfamily)
MLRAQILPYTWYPIFVAAAVIAFGAMLAADLPLALATYTPVLLVAVAVITLELWFPERLDWRPRFSDVKADAAFMGLVQVALPRGLAIVSVLALSGWIHANAPSAWWPHAWPLAAQIIAMVLAVDFLRYWLHRACHSFGPLWQLHEVHHSPEILYALNVGRFHPLEKALHFSLDTVPFLLLGVAPEVIAGYFLLYSVNGFFQHSNLRLRYGWLNYLVGSAETHRWHHARDPLRAACNFSNTTIVWDVLFGTWYLPEGTVVGDIGIMDRGYPKGFWSQLAAPFRRRGGTWRRTQRSRGADLLVALGLRVLCLIHGHRILRAAHDPMRIQRALLAGILRENNATTFGRQHRFDTIGSYDDFTRRIRVRDFEQLRPYIDAQLQTDEKALTEEAPVRYVRTSGTTSAPKNVPLTRSDLKALQQTQRRAVAFQYRACPEAFAGGIMAIVSPAYEGVLSNGKPYGSASGIVASNTPAAVRAKFVIPAVSLAIADSRVKYLLILRLALARPDTTYLGAANATTLLSLIKLYREHQTALIDDLRQGKFFLSDQLKPEVRAEIEPLLSARPQRALELAQLHASNREPRIADLLPELRLLVTWTCASAGITVGALRSELSPRTRIMELGYVSSEFRGTISLGRRSGSGFPTLDTHFFEFVERQQWERDEPEFLTLDRIRKGVDYYIIVTTRSGLYRYFINDLVRVRGFLYKTPLLQFVQKGKGVTNITGEKLYEAQVLTAVRTAMAELRCTPRFVMMLADEEARNYRLYVEASPGPKPDAKRLAVLVDAKLSESNIEYRAKRESERLGGLNAVWLAPDTIEAYKQSCVAHGQREGQFKIVALAYRRGFAFDLESFAEGCGR